MPCFHGLAVSIHTTGAGGGPLAEFGLQKQSKFHRITSYVPVPTPKLQAGSTKPEPSAFAISITLLTPGLSVPYSQPPASAEDPRPRPKIVGGHADSGFRGKHSGVIAPYTPVSASPNETIAAYIYFDGRVKEEVATLLRRGEETWVNSRWVSVPESEGGGLAEKEFIFREVGLERWLNGLDLEGKDAKAAAATVEKRRQRFERKRRIKKEPGSDDDDMDDAKKLRPRERDHNGILRYGEDRSAPVQSLSDDDISGESDMSEDDEPMPEAAGQIKVALFRVLASGEVKRGEYSPQFDVHDDEEQMNGADGGDAEIDHTTSFAKPKVLDPKSISTQTVTGIDPPDKPYAVFTFLYRGPKQLQKMGMMPSSPSITKTPVVVKRKSAGIDFGSLAPLSSSSGTRSFAGGFRDGAPKPVVKKRDEDGMDSDAEDDEEEDQRIKQEEDDQDQAPKLFLTAEEVLEESKLSEDVRKIKLKRQHSTEVMNAPSPRDGELKASPNSLTPTSAGEPFDAQSLLTNGSGPESTLMPPPTATPLFNLPPDLAFDGTVGSPFKKQRSSLPGFDNDVRKKLGLDTVAENGPRRESEGGIASAATAFANGIGTSGFGPEGIFEPGPVLKPATEEMEEEEL